MSKEPLSQGPVPALRDALVPVDVNTSTSDLDPVFGEQLAHRTHELASRVNLKELRPPQGAPLVNPGQCIGDLCRGLASQRLSLFIAGGYINDRESVAEGFSLNAVVWQKEQIRLVDLVGHRHVKLRPWYAPWGRQIDLPDGLPFEPDLDLLLSHLCCRRQLLDGCEPLPVASGAYCRPLLLRYSSGLTSLQHADATSSGSCPVVARRLVGPASIPAANRMAARSSCRQSSRLLRDIDHGVGQRTRNLMAAGRVPDLEHSEIYFVGQHC